MTPEERGALDELALGYTDEVAAARLGMSRRTLRRRVRHAMDKLGAGSRFQAGVLYGTTFAAHSGHDLQQGNQNRGRITKALNAPYEEEKT